MGRKFDILIVDDDVALALNLQDILEAEGYSTALAHDGQTTLTLCDRTVFDLALVDVKLPDMSGEKLVEKLAELSPGMEYIIITGYASLDSAMKAVSRRDVAAYETKPLNIDHVLSLIRQILERKRAEEALRESEERYRTLADNALVGIYRNSLKGDILYANDALVSLFGFDSVAEMMAGGAVVRYKNRRDRDVLIEEIKKKGKVNSFEVEMLTKTGEIRNVILNAVLEGGTMSGTLVDITERKRAEDGLKRAAEEWRTTFDSITELVSIHDRDFRLVRVNKAFADAFKMRPKELIGKTCYQVVHRTKEPWPSCPHKQTLQTKKPQRVEYFDPHLGIYLEVSTSPIFDEAGEVVAAVHVAKDITERKRAEAALRESEERYRTLLDLGAEVGEAIVMLQDTEQGEAVQTFVSDQWLRVTGYSRKELLGMSFFNLVHPKHRRASRERHRRKIQGEIIPGLFEISITRKDGTEVPVELTSAATMYKGEKVNVAYIRDITERKRMEEQLLITDRLASIGELAAGIAHELNNPLTSVIGFSQLLLSKDIPDDIRGDVKIIYSEAQRSAEVVKNLLTFARKHTLSKQPVIINSVIEKVLELRAYEQRVNNIQVITRLAPDLPEVMADYFQLQQVFLNIIVNAEYFMIEAHNRGTLAITTERVENIIRAIFVDDGPGIPEENRGHLFDPFFTTKEIGQGTGLGLSICHGIITGHGGRVYAESALGDGATFVVELPVLVAVAREELNE